MSNLEIQLSCAGLRNITSPIYENTFQFITSSGSYSCKPFIADFLSPRIARTRHVDPTLESYHISTPDPSNSFRTFLSFGIGLPISVSPSNLHFLIAVGRELENPELISQLLSQSGDLSSDNAIQLFIAKMEANLDFQRELTFLCQHCEEMWDSIRKISSLEALSSILNSNFLNISSEDWLLKELMELISTDSLYFSLLETVYFEAVSSDVMIDFTEFMPPFFENITLVFWERLSRRLIGGFFGRSNFRSAKVIPFDSSQPFNGIISNLTNKHKGNLTDLGIVIATASSSDGSKWDAKWAIDHLSEKGFCSTNRSNQWFRLDFKNNSVYITHYSILSRKDVGIGQHHPKSWVIETSIDGDLWEIIDTREDDNHLNNEGKEYTFTIENPKWGKYFQLRQTGVTHRNDHYLTFTNIEVFGRIAENSQSNHFE
jgi:hypothetical protein